MGTRKRRRVNKRPQLKIPHPYCPTLGALVWSYRRRVGGFLALIIMSALAMPMPAGEPASHAGMTPNAIGDTSPTALYRSPYPPFWRGVDEAPFPEVQKRPPCTPDLEVTWRNRCWTPHKRTPPCDAPGVLWEYDKMCLLPVHADGKKVPNSLTPQPNWPTEISR